MSIIYMLAACLVVFWAVLITPAEQRCFDIAEPDPAKTVESCSDALRYSGYLPGSDPTLGWYHVMRGRAYLKMRDQEKAKTDLKAAMGYHIANPAYIYELVLLHLDTGQPGRALRSVTALIALQPDTAAYYLAQGTAHRRLGDQSKALESYDKALELQPQEPMILNNVAWLHYLNRDFSKAEKLVDEALALAPNHIEANDTKGALLKERGATKEAIIHYMKSVEAGGADMVRHYQGLLVASGHWKGAVDGVFTDELRVSLIECIKVNCVLATKENF